MSIARRSDGRWTVKFKDMTGKWRQRSFRSEDEARRFDGDCRYDEVENERPTVAEAVIVFLQNTRHASLKVQLYKRLIYGGEMKNGRHRQGEAEFLADRYVDTLTRRDLENFRNRCRAAGNSILTINQKTGYLKAAFNWCVNEELLRENPWGKFRNLRGGKSKPRNGTLEDLQRLFPVLPPWLQWAAETAIALCLRPGMSELFGLKWDAFNWRAGTVSVYMPKVDMTKTVYAPEHYMTEAWPRYQADMQKGEKFVCRGARGRRIHTVATYCQAWKKACIRAGINPFPMYALRHIAASEMLAAGADLAAVAAQLGHANPNTTSRFYIHALPSGQRNAASHLPCIGLVQFGAEFDSKKQ